MALTGDLGSIDLANVFQMLQLSQKTGTLEVRSSFGRTEVYLDGENVLYPFDRDAFPQKVIKLLERGGRVTAEMLAKAHASQSILKRDLFALLLQMKAVTPEDITAAYREQMEEEIYELFVDRGATFEFRENEKPATPGKVIDEKYKLSGNGLIMEAARRLDEWGFIRQRVPSDRCVFEAGGTVEQIPESERDGATLDVMAALDGTRSIAEIVAKTGLTRFAVCKKLAVLSDLRVVYEVPLEVLIERARQCLRTHKSNEGLGLLERAFELGAQDPSVHEMAALAHQALQRVGAACKHYGIVAESLERAGDRRGAAEVHLRVRDLVPTDVRSRERLVRHWLDDPEFFQQTTYSAEVEATELVVILKEIGRAGDARELLQDVQSRFVEDARIISRLADVALELGDPKAAVGMLMSCADHLFKSKSEVSALRLYRRVRTIDPDHDGLEGRIASCERVSQRPSRGAGKGSMRLAASFVALAGLASVFSIQNREALAELAELPTEELALQGDFETALSTLDTFRDEHRVTFAAMLADKARQDIVQRAAVAADDAARRSDLLAQERVRRQRNAERSYDEALEMLGRGDLDGALQKMTRAADLANDAQFIAKMKPRDKVAEISAVLRRSQEGSSRYEEARRKEDWPAMHRLGVELLRADGRRTKGELLLPVRVTIDPPDATLSVAPGDSAGRPLKSGQVALLPAGRDSTLTATRDDRFPLTVKLRPESAYEVALQLDRRVGQRFALPASSRFPPVVQGDRAFFGCENGRVVALRVGTLTAEWQRVLKDLEEVGGPLSLDAQGLRIPTRSQKAVWLDPLTGDEVWRQRAEPAASAAARPALELALGGGKSFVVDPGEGRIVLRGAQGRALAAWRTSERIEWAVACKGGALFGGGASVLRVASE
jgi:hypothetical protein